MIMLEKGHLYKYNRNNFPFTTVPLRNNFDLFLKYNFSYITFNNLFVLMNILYDDLHFYNFDKQINLYISKHNILLKIEENFEKVA